MILRIADRNLLNVWDFIGLRVGFTIYSAWVNAATILNVAFSLKSSGWKDNVIFSESTWGCIVLWVALFIYAMVTLAEKNPLYGLIYIWVLFNIRK
jgi:hypothetical protein